MVDSVVLTPAEETNLLSSPPLSASPLYRVFTNYFYLFFFLLAKGQDNMWTSIWYLEKRPCQLQHIPKNDTEDSGISQLARAVYPEPCPGHGGVHAIRLPPLCQVG